MIWADKIPLAIGAIIMLALIGLHGTIGDNSPIPWDAVWVVAQVLFWKIMLPIWIGLRVFDFLAGGPRRRRGYVTARWDRQ